MVYFTQIAANIRINFRNGVDETKVSSMDAIKMFFAVRIR